MLWIDSSLVSTYFIKRYIIDTEIQRVTHLEETSALCSEQVAKIKHELSLETLDDSFDHPPIHPHPKPFAPHHPHKPKRRRGSRRN